jgi:hypothetical protein
MNKLMTSLFVSLSFLTALPLVAENSSASEYSLKSENKTVTYSLKPDGRNWKIGYEFTNPKGSMIIYILENEKLSNRSESFIVNSFSQQQQVVSVENFAEHFTAMMEKFLPGKRVGYQMVNSNPKDMLLEWWALDQQFNPSGDIHGWMRLITTPKGIVSLGYETKKTEQIGEARKIWPSILLDAKVVQ